MFDLYRRINLYEFIGYQYHCSSVYLCTEGESGKAYNIADVSCDIQLKDLAALLADIAETEVIFDLPDATEAAGFSQATKARLDSSKLKALGWSCRENLRISLEKTVKLLTILQND